ncbi:MAG: YbaB/EbfC family nucleoid-associated protein [Eubacteriales bacterium]|nr:YbaB/EbfC family nucleoid-associated protein [Eubacteriales bacterium]
MMGFGNMNKMMKQVQKMQAEMAKIQKDLEEQSYEATSGGGVVKVVVNGKNEMLDIQINPEVLDPDDVEMLQDLILAATNEALKKAQETMSTEMNKLTGNMKIPGMPGGMF